MRIPTFLQYAFEFRVSLYLLTGCCIFEDIKWSGRGENSLQCVQGCVNEALIHFYANLC